MIFTGGFKTLYHLDNYNLKTENNCQKALESLLKHRKKLSCTSFQRRPSRRVLTVEGIEKCYH